MHSWNSKYLGNRPTLAVCTDWPELISDSQNIWNIVFLDSITQRLQSVGSPNKLKRYVARVHDRNIDLEFDQIFYIQNPIPIDLSDLQPWLDLEHTAYFDINDNFIFYRRDQVWKDTVVNLELKPKIGIIFIDCWESLTTHTWQIQNFDFYQHMIRSVESYNLVNCVFHTGTYGDLPLSKDLKSWRRTRNFHDIMKIDNFKKHYQTINVTDWIVVGAHWSCCTHDKPLGFYNLLELKKQDPNLRIYSLPECTSKFVNNNIAQPIVDICNKHDYANDQLNWVPYKNLFELTL